MDITTFCEKKYLVTNTIQELYDEHTRSLEVSNLYKCESELEKKSLILTIKKQEGEIKSRDNTINRLEDENSKRNKQISEYEKMIRDLEDKMNEILIEKEEENRFDMIRNQSNTIQEKENEIIRLTNLLKKKDTKEVTKEVTKEDRTDKKIVNVLDSLVSNGEREETIEVKEVSDEEETIEVSVVKTDKKNVSKEKATDPDEDELIYGENAADIAADRMAAHIDDQPSDEDKSDKSDKEEEPEKEEGPGEESDDEEYECLTYRGKQFWIIVGEDPQYVYGIVGEDKDEVGDKLGVYKKTAGGKMKVFLDKK